jgi:hypothetical protein
MDSGAGWIATDFTRQPRTLSYSRPSGTTVKGKIDPLRAYEGSWYRLPPFASQKKRFFRGAKGHDAILDIDVAEDNAL